MSFAFTTANAATNDDTVSASATESVGTTIESDGFTWDNATVYFLLTDRFKNGNTSNDHSYNRGLNQDGSVASISDTRATFHGGDFAGVTQAIEEGYFDNLGVNALWISAPYEQIHGYVVGDNSSPSYAHYSYHGYYVLDYTQTDANFGTAEEFETLVDTAHEHGIRVVMDIVMNHAGYNSTYDMKEYNFGTVSSGWESIYYNFNNISNSTYHSVIDYDSSASDWANWWGSDWIRCGVAGYTSGGGDDITRSLEGLPDFMTGSTSTVSIPKLLQTKWASEGTLSQKTSEANAYFSSTGKSKTVTNYLSYWLSDWVRKYGVDGFRCDTAKHVELSSWNTLKTTCVDALKEWRANNPDKAGADWDEDFWMTGECWDHNIGYGYDSYYTQGGFDSMINFETQGAGLLTTSRIASVYDSYAEKINSNDKFNQLSYISSHDSTLARGDMIYTGSAFLLLPGAVQIYYGDETNRQLVSGIGNDGNGGSGHSLRSDMNWSSIDESVLQHWQKVGQFRNNHVSVGAGSNQTISAYSSSTGYTFSRTYDDGNTADSIIATIGAPKNTSINVNVSSIWNDGTVVTNFYDGTTATVTNGIATFNSGANGTILIEGPQSSISMTLKGSTSFYDSETLTVSLKGADYAMVSVDGATAFKVVDGDTFVIGKDVAVGESIKVTMSAANDEETATKSFTYKKKDPNAVTRVYFDNSKYNWSTVNAYIYDESGSEVVKNAAWPGEAMTYDSSTGLYVIEVPEELTNGRVIFNAGNNSSDRYPGDGAQGLAINGTDMIFSYGNSWTEYTGTVVDPTESTTPTTPTDSSNTITVYYDNSSTNYSTPYIYYWKSSTNSGDVVWPGVAMTKYKDNIWTATFSSDNDRCIFNVGSNQSQTGDLTIPATNYIYSNGSWSAYAEAATQPTTTQPATTTQPTTKPTTAPTTAQTTSTVKATSNLFPQGSAVVSSDSKTVTVTFDLKSTMKVVNGQWKLTYDSTKLSYNSSNNKNIMPNIQSGKVVKANTGVIYGNFTDASTLFDFTSSKTFVTVVFDIIGVGDTTVDLDVQELCVGYFSGSSLKYTDAVNKSSLVDLSNVSGYTSSSLSGKTTVVVDKTGIFGDVNGDGIIDIQDVTEIQKYLANLTTLSSSQLANADIDGDGEISIKDATEIQKYLAGFDGSLI
jgi:alpha-amylase